MRLVLILTMIPISFHLLSSLAQSYGWLVLTVGLTDRPSLFQLSDVIMYKKGWKVFFLNFIPNTSLLQINPFSFLCEMPLFLLWRKVVYRHKWIESWLRRLGCFIFEGQYLVLGILNSTFYPFHLLKEKLEFFPGSHSRSYVIKYKNIICTFPLIWL